MPRISCTFREFIAIIEAHGFALHRKGKGSHAMYRKQSGKTVWMVTVACHNENDTIRPGTLSAMIRQCGLPKHLFSK